MTFPPKVWQGVLQRLQQKLPEVTYETWILPLAVESRAADRVVVLCPSTFHRDHVRKAFHRVIHDELTAEVGASRTLEFDVRPLDRPCEKSAHTAPLMRPTPAQRTGEMTALDCAVAEATANLAVSAGANETRSAGPKRPATSRQRPRSTHLRNARASRPSRAVRPRSEEIEPAQQTALPFSFDNFVVGPCNALAREAAFALSGGQRMTMRQLYLSAPSGVGKTHLARSAAVEAAQRAGRPVRYANAEAFTNEFVAALQQRKTAEFKRRYRTRGGLLVLEDVQFLAGKRATQLEFFHTVQHVLDAGGRVLLTGDRMPHELTELDERVRTQLSGGFVAPMELPDAAVRRGILRTKAASGGIHLPDDCLDLLVERVIGSVRELEGVLTQVVTMSTLLAKPIDLELTEQAISQKIRVPDATPRQTRVEDVVAAVAASFQTTPERLASKSRRREVLIPRQLAMYLSHRYTDASLADIGRVLDRDHPSVRNAIAKIERDVLENPRLRYQVETVTAKLRERTRTRK